MKSKKKSLVLILVIMKLILDILELQMKIKKFLEGDCLFKLSKGTDLKKKGNAGLDQHAPFKLLKRKYFMSCVKL